jgi:hypothetical protein
MGYVKVFGQVGEKEKERDVAKGGKKNLLPLSLRIQRKKKIHGVVQNGTILGFFL